METREHLLRQLRRYLLAASDMRQAGGAALQLLEGPRINGDAERALETGLAICYARPFVSGKVGTISAKRDLPADPHLRALHDGLIARRRDLYAHNDETPLRTVEDVYALLGLGAGKFAESWRPIDRVQLPEIIRLCDEEEGKFRARAAEIEQRLARRVTPNG